MSDMRMFFFIKQTQKQKKNIWNVNAMFTDFRWRCLISTRLSSDRMEIRNEEKQQSNLSQKTCNSAAYFFSLPLEVEDCFSSFDKQTWQVESWVGVPVWDKSSITIKHLSLVYQRNRRLHCIHLTRTIQINEHLSIVLLIFNKIK